MTVHYSGSSQQISGTFNVTPNAVKPRYVVIWAIDDVKRSNQEQNIYNYDTGTIGTTDVACASAQIVLGGDKYYPQTPLTTSTSKTVIYRNALMFADGNNDLLSGSFMSYNTFGQIYPMFCFDLAKQENLLGSFPIEFRYNLTGAPGAAYQWQALLITEKDIMIDSRSGKAISRQA